MTMMNIVTMTTDFGTRDYCTGSIKGAILAQGAPALLVDITHDIDNYNIVQAAYTLKNAFHHFPKGSIHLISVHNFYRSKPRFLLVHHQGHFFIGPDNGIFSLMFEGPLDKIRTLSHPDACTVFGVRDVFATTVGQLLKGSSMDAIGQPFDAVLQRLALQPITGKDQIRGSVIHIDNYKNAVLNVDRPLFERIRRGRDFELYFKRYDPITQVSSNYAEVPIGEVLCLFNSANLLEIAVHMDKAATLFGLEVDEAIQIDFLVPDYSV